MVELDLDHLETAPPVGLIPQTILERTARILLSEEELYRFRMTRQGRTWIRRVSPRDKAKPRAAIA